MADEKDNYDKVLDNLEELKQTGEKFNEASKDQPKETPEKGIDSQQVTKDVPKPEYNMKGPGAEQVNREAHQQKMAQDNKYVQRANEIKNSNSAENNVNSKDENSRN